MLELDYTNTVIVGGHRPLRLEARFTDAPVVIFDGSIRYVVRTFHPGPATRATVAAISDLEWTHLCDTDESFPLATPVTTFRDARIWILRGWDRKSIGGQVDALLATGARPVIEDDGLLALCVDDRRGFVIRDQWARALTDEAHGLATRDVPAALERAELAWLLAPNLDDAAVVLLATLLQMDDRAAEAEDYLQMHANTMRRSVNELQARCQQYRQLFERSRPEVASVGRAVAPARSLLTPNLAPTFQVHGT